ncbi:DUF484 family protein [Maricaulis sp.]|uniref:DUF484 family protein n=1 Tax=Maricaulis sp. TaxID=1486257 RepID=UPI00262B7721|nr:DUF484 family protein [Maricaulis sp.]
MSADTPDTLQPSLDLERIRAFLVEHPDFIREDAELFAQLAAQPAEGGVVDLGSAAREKLLTELRQLKALNEGIVETARANLAIQAQIHSAVLALLEVDSLAGLDRKISNRLTGTLGVDVCRILIEGHAPLKSAESILGAGDGSVADILGEKVERLGPVNTDRAHEIYGQHGSRMRSEAVVRLDFNGRDGLFALASRDPHLFQFGQGTELLNFLARAIERLILQWMHHSDH